MFLQNNRLPIILILLIEVIDCPPENILHFPIEKENCHLDTNYIVCNNLPKIQKNNSKLSLYAITTAPLSGAKFSNRTNSSNLSVLNLKRDLSIQFKTLNNNFYLNNYQGLLCLNKGCTSTTRTEIAVISRCRHNIDLSDSYFNSESKPSEFEDIASTFKNIKATLMDFKTSSYLKFNMTNHIIYELDTYLQSLQNKDERSIINFVERNYKNDMEIMFHASVFLMLFVVVFSFNIYYCGSIIHCIYKDKYNKADY